MKARHLSALDTTLQLRQKCCSKTSHKPSTGRPPSVKHQLLTHFVARQLHAGEVIPLDVQLAAGRQARHVPGVDGRGQQRQAVPLPRHLQGWWCHQSSLWGKDPKHREAQQQQLVSATCIQESSSGS